MQDDIQPRYQPAQQASQGQPTPVAPPPAAQQPASFTPTPVSSPPPRREGLKSVVSTIAILLLAPLIALMLTMFVFQSYEVDGPSMETTLQNQDRLIVVKLQRTMAKITGHAYIPNRGDVIIFNRHGAAALLEGDKQLIKRVIGLPGERVVVKDGVVTVFNKEHPRGFSPDKTMPYGSVIQEVPVRDIDTVVPNGEVFVCGDNRANSLDSRYFGTVPAHDIVGKLGLRIYPFNKAEVF